MSTRLERVLNMVSEINRGNYPTVVDLCDKFEIKQRTLFEDIRFIKDRLRIEIIFDKQKSGYYNSTPDAKLPDFDLSQSEILALMLGKEMLLEYSGPVFRVQLEQAFSKIATRLVKRETVTEEELHALIQIIPGGVPQTDGKNLHELKDACEKLRTVEIDYYAAHNGETSTRKIDPYRILEYQAAWYIVAWCHLRKDLRKFAIHRIRRLKVLNQKFSIPEDLDLDAWIGSAFQLEHRDGEQKVTIRFTPIGARFAIDRQWHHSQKLTSHADGSCTLEFTTQSFDEVKRWVLPFGSGAEVIDPPELRRRVMEELQQTLKGYSEQN